MKMKKIEIENFRDQQFSTEISMKMFDEIFDLKNFRRPISKFSNYGSNKPFRLKFCAKLCRIQRRRPWNQKQGEWRAWEASAKKKTPYKKKDTFREVCPETIRFGFRNLASLPYQNTF